MSSLRLSEPLDARESARASGWIVIEPACEEIEERSDRPQGVVLSLRARRRDLENRTRRAETVYLDTDADAEDDDLARDIEADLDGRWDS